MQITLEWNEAGVALATWADGDNRLNPDSMGRLHAILDEVSDHEGPTAFVLTGSGKFFSNGLDLDRFEGAPEELGITFRSLHGFMGRILSLPVYTVCAINGHAFAGGAMVSSVFDYKVMREDRGFWCLNEIDIKVPVSAPMTAGLSTQIPRSTLSEAMLTGRRFSGPEALDAGIVQQLAAEEDVLPAALERAAEMAGKDRDTMRLHKGHLFGDAARFLAENS
jgi:enoyl-CoA hydratase/carnithine racemase